MRNLIVITGLLLTGGAVGGEVGNASSVDGDTASDPAFTMSAIDWSSAETAPVPAGLLPHEGLALDAGLPRDLPAAAAPSGNPDPIPTDWRVLLGLDYQTGEVTDALKERDGKVVSIPGFMVPFEDGITGVNEFLLVPYFGACIHTPPPPPNQMVYIRMADGATVDVNIWDAVVIEGVLEVTEVESTYGPVGHKVTGLELKPYSPR